MKPEELTNMKYVECLVLKEAVVQTELIGLTKTWSDALVQAGAPIEAFALGSVGPNIEGVTLWVSPVLAKILDDSKVNWRRYVVDNTADLPSRSEVTMLVGDQRVMDELW